MLPGVLIFSHAAQGTLSRSGPTLPLMKKLLPITLLTVAATTATAGAQSLSGLELGLTGGYAGGLSGEIFVHAPNVAGPVGVKAGLAYSRGNNGVNDSAPYDPSGVLFPNTYTIANAKNDGFVTGEGSSSTVASLDATYGLGEVTPGVDATLYGGGRYGMFNASESSGSNTTTYSSNAFGIGAGVMVSYALTGGLSLVGDLGVDQYFKSGTINTNDGRGNTGTIRSGEAGYSAIDNRVVRPGTVFKARIGLKTSY